MKLRAIVTKKYKFGQNPFLPQPKHKAGFVILCLSLCLACPGDAVSRAETIYGSSETITETAGSETSKLTVSKNDISVSFTYGFEKCSKYGRKMNVIANVTNTGKNFSGTIGILSVPYGDSEQTLYEVPCILAEGESKKIELTATISASNWPSLLIKDEKERTVLQKFFRVTMTTQPEVVFAGILTDDTDSISYISSTGLAKMFLLDETTLPSTAAGLDSLDLIMISNFNTDRLSDEQIHALSEWTKKGGTLVFGTGATAAKTLSAFQGILFNGTIGEPQKRTTFLGMSQAQFLALKDELYAAIDQPLDVDEEQKQQQIIEETEKETENETIAEASTNPSSGNDRISRQEISALTLKPMKKDMAAMNFDNFAPVLSENDEFPLIIKRNYGKGTVLAAAFELGMSPKYRTSMGVQLYKVIENNFSKTKQNQLNDMDSGDYYTLSHALSANAVNAYPHLTLYFFILLIYALFTGPILYFILKKMDKRHLLWGLMPASCLICTAVIYLAGSKSRITEPYIHYLSFLKMDQTSEELLPQQEVYFNITSPYNKSYSITLPGVTDVDVRSDMQYGISYSYENEQPKESSYYKTALYQNGDNATTLIMKDYAAFHAACFHCTLEEGTSAMTGAFDCSLKLKKDFTVTGTLTNQLGCDLIQAAYICNGRLYILGSMKQGDTVSLKDCESCIFNSIQSIESSLLPSGQTPLEAIAGGHGWDSDSTLLERQMYFAFEYYLGSSSSLFSDSGRLIAVTEQGSIDFLKESGLQTSGLQLLDISMEPVNSDNMSIQALDQSFSSVMEGNMDYPYYRYIANGQTINYHIKQPEKAKALIYPKSSNGEFSDTNTQGYDSSPVFKGTVSAYNLKTGTYDVLFTSGTAGKCTDLSPYLSADGQITLRYDTDGSSDYEYVVPYLYLMFQEKT